MGKTSIFYYKMVVADSESLARFYDVVFGMKEIQRYDALDDEDPHLEIILSASGDENDRQIALMHYVNRPAPSPGEAAIALLVDDVDATVAAALAAGGRSTRAAVTLDEYKFRFAMIVDPEGHALEVMQHLA